MRKTATTIALAAILAGASHAAISGKKPAFMDKRQLAAMRAEAVSKSDNRISSAVFFTGRPYLAACAGYLFKFRSYDPGIARWTTEDPSGFPDGANSSKYAPCPTNDLDYGGLLKWSTLTNMNSTHSWTHGGYNLVSDMWTVETNDGSETINLRKNTRSADGADLSDWNFVYNCHGYTFGNSEYWIPGQVWEILKGDGYKLITGEDKTGARVAYWGANAHSAEVLEVNGQGEVTSVKGKRGALGLLTSTPEGQDYEGEIKYYE